MFTPIENKRVYRQVVEQIQQMVLDGRLREGDKLPPERELAERLDVSRPSVREGMRALEILGIVESRQGGGNYIRSDIEASLFQPLSVMFKLRGGSFSDILETRRIMEPEAAAVAAVRMSPEQKSELGVILDRLVEARHQKRKSQLDMEFHLKIVEGSGNCLVRCFYGATSALMDSFFAEARKMVAEWRDHSRELEEQHRTVFEAIRDGDGSRAGQAMRIHLDTVVGVSRR